MQLSLTLVNDGLLVGRHTVISFNRTLRIPEDGKRYDLPAGFGRLPILRVEDVADRVPEKWRREGGLIIPLYQREALFLEFSGADWRPVVAKAAVGNVNAITGKPHDLHLKIGRQDYVVIPTQKWLDGIYFGNNTVKQFVAMPLGQGYTIEAQVTDEEQHGGFQLAVFEPKDGKFSEPQQKEWSKHLEGQDLHSQPALYSQSDSSRYSLPKSEIEMGIAAGGAIKQQIFEDEYGIETWDQASFIALNIHIVNSAVYEEITGKKAPITPITTEDYVKRKLPWFTHYDETRRSVFGPKVFKKALSVFHIDAARGKPVVQNVPISTISAIKVRTLTLMERIDELREMASSCYRKQMFSECVTYSRLCGELIERHKYEVECKKPRKSPEEMAAECFCIASECSAEINEMKSAEIFSNRALNLFVSEVALSRRLFARFHNGDIDGAQKDCDELKSLYPENEYARKIQKIFAQNEFRATSNPVIRQASKLANNLPSEHIRRSNAETKPKDSARFAATKVPQGTSAAPQPLTKENTYSSTASIGFIAVLLLIFLPFILIIFLASSNRSSPRLPENVSTPTPPVLLKAEVPSMTVDSTPAPVTKLPILATSIQTTPRINSCPDSEYTVIGLQSGDKLNVREGPGVRFSRVSRLENGVSGIHVIAGPRYADQATWYQIERKGMTGWVNSQYLDPTPLSADGLSSTSTRAQGVEATATVAWNGQIFTVREAALSAIEAKIRASDAYVQRYSQLHAEHIALQEKLRKSGPLGVKRLTQQISTIEASMNRAEQEGDRVIASMHDLIRKSEVR